MGSIGSKAAKKAFSPLFGSNENDCNAVEVTETHHMKLASPFVFSRKGSMYFDQDGDLAHEFYEEISFNKPGKKNSMKKISTNLIPQGDIEYPVPRLHPDFHKIMCPS